MKKHKSSTHASPLISITVAGFVTLPTIAGAAEPWGTWVRPSTGTPVGVVKLEGSGGLRLDGCALGGMICEGETWQKAK